MPELFGKPKEMGLHYIKTDEFEQLPKRKEILEKRKEINNETK